MDMAFLGACPGASLAADAVLGMCHGHDLVAHIVSVLIISGEGFLDQFEHLITADLETPSAADALLHVDRIHKLRRPRLPAAGCSVDGGHCQPPVMKQS